MDFLRHHLPGLHRALRGALGSFSTFVSYLVGDDVPTVEREARAAEERGEVASGRPEKVVEEEAQEALEGLRGSHSKGDDGPRGPGEARRRQKGSSASEQTWGWGEGSSHGSQEDRQNTGAWEAAKAARCLEPSAPLQAEAGSEDHREGRSQAQESQELNVQEVNRGETLRTWEQEEEEEEEVRAREPGMARGVESEWPWHGEPEGKAGADGQKVAGDNRETEQVVKEAVVEEAEGAGREDEVLVVVRGSQSTRAQGTHGPEAESEDRATLGREEARTTSFREGTDLPGVRETEYGPVPEERIPEAPGRAWVPEEALEGDQEEEVDEKSEAEVSLFPKQIQALGTEGLEEAAEGQTAAGEAAGDKEAGEGFEGQADQCGREAEERQDSEIRADWASLEEPGQVEEAQEEEGHCWATEAGLPLHKEAEGDADLEISPEAGPEEEFAGKRNEEAHTSREAWQVQWGGLKHEVTEGQEPEKVGGVQILTKYPKEGQGGKEELWSIPSLSKDETKRSLEEYPGHTGHGEPEASEAESWENWRRKHVERGNTQEEKAGAEKGEDARGQALEAEAQEGRQSARAEVPEEGGEWKRAAEAGWGAEEGEASQAENQELEGGHGAEAGTGQTLEESKARETKDREVETAGPWAPDGTCRRGWRLEVAALSGDPWPSSLAAEMVEDEAGLGARAAGAGEAWLCRRGWRLEVAALSGDPWPSSLAAEMVEDEAGLGARAAGAGEAWQGELGRGRDSEGKEEAGAGAELAEAAGQHRGGQEFGLEDPAEEEVTSRGDQAEAFEAREGEPGGGQAEVGEPAMVEGSCGMDHFTLGTQAVRAEGTVATVEAEGLPGQQVLLEKEAEGWQATEQREGSEGRHGDHHLEGEARRSLDVEDVEVTGGRRAEAKETDPEGLEDVKGQEECPTSQDLAEAAPGPHGDAETAVATRRRRSPSSWSEVLLPGTCLDVSIPRNRVLLSRSSSQRRSRPSFRRTPASEQQEEPPSPQPEEGLSAPEQKLLQLEEPPEPRPMRPEGTPVPARRRPLGHGFGLAYPGMMQELQARLGQPKHQ
ncbi:PREDICTED: apolipoprotein B receptor [Galeopterus variegatus]|uniref:Apolipoprotein B receptor n=1 Tax=Galeopterus variegatus TaxID=482537 RepID=A0ABM0R9H4_GALVR|nr:PREDICTED: apolipoprotein B receptor [Galeopterus variegatus]